MTAPTARTSDTKPWKTVGEPEDLGALLHDFTNASGSFAASSGEDTAPAARLKMITERLEHHPQITDSEMTALRVSAPLERGDTYSPEVAQSIAASSGANYAPRKGFKGGMTASSLQVADIGAQDKFDRQKAARAAIPKVREVTIPEDLSGKLMQLQDEYPHGAMTVPSFKREELIAEKGDELRETKARQDRAALKDLDRYVQGESDGVAPGTPTRTVALREADLDSLHESCAGSGVDLGTYRELIPQSQTAADNITFFNDNPVEYDKARRQDPGVPESPEIAVFKSMATGSAAPLDECFAAHEAAGVPLDTNGLVGAQQRAESLRKDLGVAPQKVDKRLRAEVEKYGPDEVPGSTAADDLESALRGVVAENAEKRDRPTPKTAAEAGAQENASSPALDHYNDVLDRSREDGSLTAAQRSEAGSLMTRSTFAEVDPDEASKLVAGMGLGGSEADPGEGRVMASRTHVFRDAAGDGQWQQRPKGESGEWTKAPALPPSAKPVSSAEAADAIGGNCLNCGRALTNATRHGGYGPECAKKIR